jgi:hypothetical protein
MPEIYVSTDIEADGPIPGPHSMLSFASAAYLPDKKLHGSYSANLVTLPGAAGDPRTMDWWKTKPEAWAACRANAREPAEVMPEYVYAMALLGKGYRDSVKRNMPKKWFDDIPHTHVALDDALGQGALFCNMLAERERIMKGGN